MSSIKTLISAGGKCGIERDILNEEYKYLIGVDSGITHLYRLFFQPTHLVGDLDSISERDLERARKDEAIFIELSPDKNRTDLEAAYDLALELDSEEIILIGGEEGDVDQLFGILLLCASFASKIKTTWIQNEYSIYFQNEITLNIDSGKMFSVIAISDLKNVIIQGAKWNIDRELVLTGSSKTLRNESIGDEIKIKIGEGKAAIAVKT
tara:strand:- start:516 stop:1142 length:627 start_codon:yes stop_codon:yes gene_type:complete